MPSGSTSPYVHGLEGETEDRAAIIELAHSLKLITVAEGVETGAQLAFLRQQGCDQGQGYYFSRPLPAAEFGQLLTERGAQR